jgi:glycosyltransferase involved in cell wall biosynthesis
MPEVADGAGLLFNPHQIEEITRAMRDILLDAELRGRMERLGLQRAAGFTWQKSARATLDVYKEVVAAASGHAAFAGDTTAQPRLKARAAMRKQ